MALHEHGVQNTSNTNKKAVKKPAVAKESNQLKFGNQVIQLGDEGEIIARRPVGDIRAGDAEKRKTNK